MASFPPTLIVIISSASAVNYAVAICALTPVLMSSPCS